MQRDIHTRFAQAAKSAKNVRAAGSHRNILHLKRFGHFFRQTSQSFIAITGKRKSVHGHSHGSIIHPSGPPPQFSQRQPRVSARDPKHQIPTLVAMSLAKGAPLFPG